MAETTWQGGTTGVAQVSTGTVGGSWAENDTIRTTLTLEDGSTTQAVTSTATGATIETDVIDVHVIDLNNSTETEFAKITWTKGSSTTIVGTADNTGIPFVLPAGSVPAGSGSYSSTFAATTANAGPNDAGTAANWSGASVPASTNDVYVLPHPTDEDASGKVLSYSVLYGLDQSAKTYASLKIGKAFEGSFGDPVNGFHYIADVDSGSAKCTINSSGQAVWLNGSYDQININGGRGLTDKFIRIKGGAITNLRILGPLISGVIIIEDSCAVTNIYMLDCPGVELRVGTSGTVITLLEANSGRLKVDRAITTAHTMGSLQMVHTVGAVNTWNNRGAYVFYNGNGTITNLNNFNGTFDLRQNTGQTSTTISNAIIYGGLITDRGGVGNIVYTNDIISHGGDVQSESGTVIAYT